jgi:GNAT superfamily N-acetyltransferase
MAYKMLEGRVLFESEKFRIKEAAPAERDALDNMLKKFLYDDSWHRSTFSLPHLTIVAVDKETNKVIGGIDRELNTLGKIANGEGLIVLPEYRREGVGRKLLEEMDGALKKMGMRRVETMPNDENAWEFFKENGYEYDMDNVPVHLIGVDIDKERYYYGFPMKKYL